MVAFGAISRLKIKKITWTVGGVVKDVAWGPSEFPKPPWLGPGRHPRTQRIGLSRIALGWGCGGVDYVGVVLVFGVGIGLVFGGRFRSTG